MLSALCSRESGKNSSFFFPRWCSWTFGRKVDLSSKTFGKVFKHSVSCIDIEKAEHRYVIAGYSNGGIVIYDTAHNPNSTSYPPVTSIDRSVAGAHKHSVDCIQWYPHDSGIFMSLSGDKMLKIWDTCEVQVAEKFSFSSDIYSFHMSEKAKRHSTIAVTAEDKNVYMCDLKSGSKSHSLTGHLGPVLTVQWSPKNENILCSASVDGQIYMWDFRKAKSYLASFVSDTAIGTNEAAHQGSINGLRYSSDGLYLLSYASDNTMKLWDINSQTDTKVNYGVISNDARRNVNIAITQGLLNELVYVPSNNNIDVFELLSGKYIQTLFGHFLSVNCCLYNKWYQELYSGSADMQLLIWEQPRNHNEEANEVKDSWSDDES